MKQTIKIIKGNASHMRRKRPTDCLHHVPTMKVKRNAGRRASDAWHRTDALTNKYSYNVTVSMLRDKYEAKAETQREARREARRAKSEAKAMHA